MKKTVALILAASLLLTVIGCASTSSVPESRPQDQTVQNSEKPSQSSSSSAQSSQSSSAQTSKPSTATPSKPSVSQSSSAQSSVAPTPTPAPTPAPTPTPDPLKVEDIYGIYRKYKFEDEAKTVLNCLVLKISDSLLTEKDERYERFDIYYETLPNEQSAEQAWEELLIQNRGLIYQGERYVAQGDASIQWDAVVSLDGIVYTDTIIEYVIQFRYDRENEQLTIVDNSNPYAQNIGAVYTKTSA